MHGTLWLLLECAVTWWMVAVIWFVQCVHYPLFARVGREGFAAYERDHTRRITWVVAPPMIIELVLAVRTAVVVPSWASADSSRLGLACVVALWLSTFLLQVPQHNRLQHGFDASSYRRLVRTNWLRTALWSMRGAIVAGYLLRALG